LNLSYELSTDKALIRQVITDPAIYSRMGDDFAPPAEEYQPPDGPFYLIVRDGAELLGLWAFFPENAISWEIHTALLPIAGNRVWKAAQGMLAWLWANTNCQRLWTKVPEWNRQALIYARRAGMREYGRNPDSFMKNGKVHAQILLGISRPKE
jgi:RimJ/RimL family protein N-acetyltransferase